MTDSGTDTRSRSLWNLSVALLVLSAALLLVARSSADPDLWGHVRFGQDVLRSGSIPTTDPYSYLSGGKEWINHEILSEVTFAAAFDLFGPTGLILVRLTVCLVILLLLYRHLITRGLTPVRAGLILLLAMPALRIGMVTTRPHLFTHLFFLIMLLILEASTRRPRYRGIWTLPLLFAIWINFHGGVLAGLGVLATWVVVESLRQVSPRSRRAPDWRTLSPRWLGVGLASAVALLANPYGWKLPAFLIRTGTVARPEITEWLPVRIASPPGVVYLIVVGLACAALTRSARTRHPAAMAVLFVAGLAPLLAVRNIALFAIAVIVITAKHWASSPPPSVTERRLEAGSIEGRRALRVRHFATSLSLVAATALLGLAASEARCIRIRPPSTPRGYPVPAVDLLARSGVSGNLAVAFDWGEYAIWHLAPRVRVSIDGRRETVYPETVYQEYRNFALGLDRWDALLDDHPTDLALIPKNRFPVYNLMVSKPGWTLVYEDTLSALFAREDHPGLESLSSVTPQETSDNEQLCFP